MIMHHCDCTASPSRWLSASSTASRSAPSLSLPQGLQPVSVRHPPPCVQTASALTRDLRPIRCERGGPNLSCPPLPTDRGVGFFAVIALTRTIKNGIMGSARKLWQLPLGFDLKHLRLDRLPLAVTSDPRAAGRYIADTLLRGYSPNRLNAVHSLFPKFVRCRTAADKLGRKLTRPSDAIKMAPARDGRNKFCTELRRLRTVRHYNQL